tara:strand:+ start:29 stop:1378 length:1350 start_codon:yes stop_codon:yes gene_type:complete
MANSYLYRTPGAQTTAGRKTWTYSVWLKRSILATSQNFLWANQDGSNYERYMFDTSDRMYLAGVSSGSTAWEMTTTRVFRDPNAWYHIVIVRDTTQGSASNRLKLYVNGTQITTFGTNTPPAQDYTGFINSTNQHNIGRGASSEYFGGYMSHASFVDSTALTPTSFGQTDSTSGIWKFKSPSGVTFGTNGFHLKFESSGNLGLDSSGNTNNFTVGGDLKQTLDTPSNSYSTLNELARVNNYDQRYVEHINGNTTCQGTSTSNNGNSYSTLGVDSGKWYCEVKVNGVYNSIYPTIGYISETNTNDSSYSQIGYTATGTGGYKPDGEKIINGSGSSYGDSFTAGDIIGVALDMDNGAIYFSKNGTFQDSGNPASGASKTGAAFTFTPDGNFHFFGASPYRSNSSLSFNFGGGNFGTTAIASAGSNGNGSLFEYDVPTGYYALNTKNINTYG